MSEEESENIIKKMDEEGNLVEIKLSDLINEQMNQDGQFTEMVTVSILDESIRNLVDENLIYLYINMIINSKIVSEDLKNHDVVIDHISLAFKDGISFYSLDVHEGYDCKNFLGNITKTDDNEYCVNTFIKDFDENDKLIEVEFSDYYYFYNEYIERHFVDMNGNENYTFVNFSSKEDIDNIFLNYSTIKFYESLIYDNIDNVRDILGDNMKTELVLKQGIHN